METTLFGILKTQTKGCFSLLQAGVKHVILAVSYRAEMLEAEMKEQEEKVSISFPYRTSNSRKCMGVNGEALQLHAVNKKLYFVLQVTRESISGITSHVRVHIRYYKSHAYI